MQEKLERELGFRIGRRGLEHLEFEEIRSDEGPDGKVILTKHNVRAVSPSIPLKLASRLWQFSLDYMKAAELAKRETQAWKRKAFEEHERFVMLENQLEIALTERDAALKDAGA
jgi:hypothetical protein